MAQPNNLTVAIVYGFAEGKWHGRKLRRELSNAGFRFTHDLQAADIVIAHSAGCYLLPPDMNARLIVHSGYTYWSGRKLLDSLLQNLRLEYQQHGFIKWFVRCTINDLYMLNLSHTIRTVRGWPNRVQFLKNLQTTRHVFICSRHDPYCQPRQLMQHTRQEHTYISTAGNHNALWDDPANYTIVLLSLL